MAYLALVSVQSIARFISKFLSRSALISMTTLQHIRTSLYYDICAAPMRASVHDVHSWFQVFTFAMQNYVAGISIVKIVTDCYIGREIMCACSDHPGS